MVHDHALELINEQLGLSLCITVKGDELKGYRRDEEEGGVHKFYLGKLECALLSEAFEVLSATLKRTNHVP